MELHDKEFDEACGEDHQCSNDMKTHAKKHGQRMWKVMKQQRHEDACKKAWHSEQSMRESSRIMKTHAETISNAIESFVKAART